MHLAELVAFLLNWRDANPNGSKKVLAAEVLARTDLKLDKALLVGKHCVLRISQMQEVGNDSSAVAAFRKIEEYDDRPIVVCLFTSRGMRLLLANSTFLEKVSDRSYRLTSEHLAGSILDADFVAFAYGDVVGNGRSTASIRPSPTFSRVTPSVPSRRSSTSIPTVVTVMRCTRS